MTIKKFVAYPQWMLKTCKHPEHELPTQICLPNGTYEHECPGCGRIIPMVIKHPIWSKING
jgi:hypothetical protein